MCVRSSLADPAAIGSGLTALTTLMHEAGHAAHFANIVQGSPVFAQERAPFSVSLAETQSMFLDSLLRCQAGVHGCRVPLFDAEGALGLAQVGPDAPGTAGNPWRVGSSRPPTGLELPASISFLLPGGCQVAACSPLLSPVLPLSSEAPSARPPCAHAEQGFGQGDCGVRNAISNGYLAPHVQAGSWSILPVRVYIVSK